MLPSTDARDAPDGLDALVALLRDRRVVVLSGAGCSTESGIPDYRGPDGRLKGRSPMKYQEFVAGADARRRDGARRAGGGRRGARARPNPAHRALAALEDREVVRGVITQNVDGLHQEAGSRRVVELHGTLDRVRCLDCDALESRARLQERIEAANPGWRARARPASREAAPDGDAEVEGAWTEGFRVPGCLVCGGVLKPDVVFFGESVPRPWVQEAWDLFADADVLLVVGSSLTVYSGRRFVYRARDEAVPIGVVNLGPTRADDVARIKVEGRVGTVLPGVVEALLSVRSPAGSRRAPPGS